MTTTRKCPYCAEEIAAEAIRCRYCRSRLGTLNPEHWYRNHPDRRIAGVAIAISRALAVPVGVVRIGFIVSTFFHLLGPILYGALWLVIPGAPGEESVLEQGLAWAKSTVAQCRGPRRPPAGAGSAPTGAGGPDHGAAAPGGSGR